MRKVNYKGRCTKRKLSKCKDVCRTFDVIQMKAAEILQANDDIKLSTNELLICNEMSVSSLITENRGYEAKLKAFKKALKEYCQEMGYI